MFLRTNLYHLFRDTLTLLVADGVDYIFFLHYARKVAFPGTEFHRARTPSRDSR
jgi:hypothetical protein